MREPSRKEQAMDFQRELQVAAMSNQHNAMKRVNGFVSKAELRDRIDTYQEILGQETIHSVTMTSELDAARAEAKRATRAAYDLLATLVVIVVYTFGIKPW